MSTADSTSIVFAPIPEGEATCDVSPIVNVLLTLKENIVLDPSGGPHLAFRAPSFVFYIKHKPTGKTLLYDLGVRYDFETAFPPNMVKVFKELWKTTIIDDVGKIIEKGGADPEKVSALLFSHEHWDHTGYIGSFPNADLVGGPETFTANLKEQVDTAGRTPKPINFWEGTKRVGAFDRAYDYFGDGSVWLCHTPGHTKDHMSALIRVTPSPNATYLLFGGDTAHHPCLLCTHHSHAHYSLVPTFRNPQAPADAPEVKMHYDAELARDSIRRTKRMETEENVMGVMAHEYGYWRAWRDDKEVMFPGTALTNWKEKGMKLSRKYDTEEYEQ